MEWTPTPEILSDIINLLRQADSPDSQVQKHLAEAIGRLQVMIDAPCYYCYILTECAQEATEVRQRAGLLLKSRLSNLVMTATLGTEQATAQEQCVLSYVKSNVLKAILDPSRELRATAGSILTALVAQQGVEGVPNLLPFLLNLLDHQDEEISDGALSAFTKIVEDEVDRNMASPSTHDETGEPASFYRFCVEHFLPKLFQIAISAGSVKRRCQALVCLNHFERGHLFAPGDVFAGFFTSYWETLGRLAMDPAPEMRHLVLSGLAQVALLTPDVVLTNLESLMSFVLDCLEFHQAYEVRLECLELLSNLLKRKQSHPFLSTLLPRLLPLLVQNTRYSAWDYMQMDQNQLVDGNAFTPDTAEDLAPVFHRQRGAADEDDDDEGEEAGGRSTWGSGWTVRKASALLLDHLSTIFGEQILPHLLPVIEGRLQSDEWETKESAVLTLGAIARGCIEGLNPFLPQVLEVLLPMCAGNKPILRSISLWTLSRFSLWICPQPEILNVTCRTLLSHIMDTNKRVQEAACSAFACLEEDAGDLLVPYLPMILDTFSKALQTFQVRLHRPNSIVVPQAKNMLVLLDAIGTLADTLGPLIDIPDFHAKIVGPLLKRWATAERTDPTLVVMFECVSCIVRAIRQGLSTYAPAIVDRCLFFIRDTLRRLEQPSDNLVECSFDLLSSLCEAAPGDLTSILSSTDIMSLLHKHCELSSLILGSSVKQGCFALIGDLAEHAPSLVTAHIATLCPAIIPYISTTPASVSHNASWAIGQLALHAARNGELTPYAERVCAQLVRVMFAPFSYESLIRNNCITLGRVALVCPDQAVPEMQSVFGMWCRTMADAPNDKEKTVAIQGLCNVLSRNQDLAIQHMPAFLDLITSLYASPSSSETPGQQQEHATNPPPSSLPSYVYHVPPEVHTVLVKILTWLSSAHPAEWSASMAQLKPASQTILTSLCSG